MKTIFQNIRDWGKAVHTEIFTNINAYIKKEERTKTNNLTFHLKKLEKEE